MLCGLCLSKARLPIFVREKHFSYRASGFVRVTIIRLIHFIRVALSL